ncbi:MAG: DUF853 family protein [Armatimonadetes bacterium]|nr:DUF853 family protein [Armatimonadota bacterium]
MGDLNGIYFGQAEGPVNLTPKFGNRHGLIAGATGTGKTVSLQTLAEGFSRIGVPVFMADVKGDLAGISQAGGGNDKVEARAKQIGLTLQYTGFPVVYWDLYGQEGHPVRATVSEMGPLLLSRLLDLNETQEGVLNVAFKLADDQGLLLLDLKDLRSLLQYVADSAKELTIEYGNVSPATIGTIQRALLVLEQQGADQFFGEPALNLNDLMRTGYDGRGFINILAADKLMQSPRLYATFLLWLLSELFEDMPEVGDPDKPKLVFFFDEAHLLFNDAPKALLEKIEQVVRLIRSKGVGVYFVTQNPIDVPDTVLAQLGNKVQHALRAFTPRDQKAVKASAETFRANPGFSTEQVITELAVGEALVSFLEEKGTPMVVQRTLVAPPNSRLGPVTPEERRAVMSNSPVKGQYDQAVDRESAFENLQARAAKAAQDAQQAPEPMKNERVRHDPNSPGEIIGAMAKSVARAAGTQLGHQLIRGVLGSLFRGR